jgi:hypothetical protein
MGISAGADVVEDGLVFCVDAASKRSYPGTGTVWTDLAGENDGTLTNGPTFSSDNGGSIVFDGSDDYVENTTNDFAFTNSFTVCVWVKAHTVGNWDRIVDYSHFASPRNGWFIGWYSSSGKYEFRLDTIGGGDGSLVSNTIVTNEWNCICGVYDSSTNSAVLYENSILVDSQTTSGTEAYSSVTKLGIGARLNPSPTEYFDGDISNILIHNSALTADEVLQNYNATRGRYR